ncbi:MAG: penicillin acylase family protein, partial [Actinomycetota bacterium]|nr:penicillin acylase family protein [Actinomycetota bacterium]
MGRRAIAAAALLGLMISPAQVVLAQDGPPKVKDPMRAFSIVPPGQEGDVTAPELASGDFGPHYADQLDMYASLVDDDDVSEGELDKYFHSMQFGPNEVARSYQPTGAGDTTVYRDELGIPHIYADSLLNASYALGYVSAEDRLWEMDVFRHAARGTLALFVGPGENDAYLKMDIDTRREGHTEEEVKRMFDRFDDKFGKVGKLVQDGLQAYAAGINQYIMESKSAAASERPVEYEATGNPYPAFPQEWTPTDTLFLVVLQLRVFGETAGNELYNAAFYAHLAKKLGPRVGPKIYDDLLARNDPRSYTSVPRADGKFPSQRLGPTKRASFAIPDNIVQVVRELRARDVNRRSVLEDLGFRSPASNAILVGAKESASGNPLQIGAPQVGYAVPSFFMDIDVHAPGIHFRGPAVPGASVLIPLGRGQDYAWSLTTGFSDAVDTRVELLCEPGGGKPTVDSNGYMFKGECREMESREETFMVKPTPVDPGPPRQETHTFYRTVHGPVFKRGEVDGRPVAFVKERFFWKKELDSVPQFYKWNAAVDGIEDFARAAAKFTMSFNTFYADAKHIGYFHVGFYPRRAAGVHPSLPIWGTGQWEWRGRLPFSRHPKVIDPNQGWVVNWNNKPARGWDNYDGFKWGPVHRVDLLADKMHALLDGRARARLSDIVDVIREAATQDTRAVYLGPQMLRWVGRNPTGSRQFNNALGGVRRWIQAGGHRLNSDGDQASMDKAYALRIFDAWYETLVHRVFDDELGRDAYALMRDAPLTDYAPRAGSSFWFDFSSFLWNLFHDEAARRYTRNYCDDLETKPAESCAQMTRAALKATYRRLSDRLGTDYFSWVKAPENITFSQLGAGEVRDIPWQNRGTHN